MIQSILLVSLGASLGAPLRYMVSKVLLAYPAWLATFGVNTLGSFLMGFTLILIQKKFEGPLSQPLSLLLLVGFLGSFTTFSAFSRDLYFLLERGFWHVLLLVLFQVGVGVAVFWAGLRLAEKVFP